MFEPSVAISAQAFFSQDVFPSFAGCQSVAMPSTAATKSRKCRGANGVACCWAAQAVGLKFEHGGDFEAFLGTSLHYSWPCTLMFGFDSDSGPFNCSALDQTLILIRATNGFSINDAWRSIHLTSRRCCQLAVGRGGLESWQGLQCSFEGGKGQSRFGSKPNIW